MDTICRAVALDAMTNLSSSLIISLGQEPSAIGWNSRSSSSGEKIGSNGGSSDGDGSSGGDSMWSSILTHCQALQDEKTITSLSMIEVMEESSSNNHHISSTNHKMSFNPSGLRDVLDPKNTPNLTLRHTDMMVDILILST